MTKAQRTSNAVEAALAALDRGRDSEHAAGRGTVGSLQQLKTFRTDLEVLKGQIMSGRVPPPDPQPNTMDE